MKYSLLFIGLTTILFFKSSGAQEITSEELIGTWDKTGNANEKLSFKFSDNSNLIVEGSQKTDKFSYKLYKDTVTNSLVIVMEMDKGEVKQTTHYTIERINPDTLKLIALSPYDNSVQMPSDKNINKGTFYVVRRKKR